MPDSFSQQIINKIEQASGMYHRLVLIVAPSGSGITSALREVQQNLEVPLINVNLEISRRLHCPKTLTMISSKPTEKCFPAL